MSDQTQLPFLLKLLDDESETIRDKIWDELESYGTSLEVDLERLEEPPEPTQMIILRDLIKENRKKIFRKKWLSWLFREQEKEKLEEAFCIIADYLNGEAYPVKLGSQLDEIASEYDALHDQADVLTLARFLFETKKLHGTDSDYYNPHNSDLVFAIQVRQGLPISLASIYILVGHRLGLDIKGCNMPGHFFARVEIDKRVYLIDCFNNGQVFLAEEFHPFPINESHNLRSLLYSPPDTKAIIRRVLMNLIRAYQHEEDNKECEFLIERLNDLNTFQKQ